MALIATVLLSVVAATIAFVTVRQTLLVTRTAGSRSEITRALRLADEARQDVEARLAADPRFFLSEVHPLERARLVPEDIRVDCLVDPDDEDQYTIQPGDTWPSDCGPTWSYVKAAAPEAARVEIVPPSTTDPALRIRILAAAGQTDAGYTLRYVQPLAGRFALLSGTHLRLDSSGAAVTSQATIRINGPIYSGGQLTSAGAGEAANASNLSASIIAAELGFTGGSTPAASRLYSATPAGATFDIRRVAPTAVSGATLRAGVTRLAAVGCSDAAPLLIPDLNISDSNDEAFINELCLEPGRPLIDYQGNDVTPPSATKAFLIKPSGSNLEVHYSTAPMRGLTCTPTCTAEGTALAAGHPGNPGYWSLLGIFDLPTTGVVASTVDLHVGQCGTGAFSGGACTQTTFPHPVTFVAGNGVAGADLYLGGPILSPRDADPTDTSLADHSIGVAASSSVLIPYWSRTAVPGTDCGNPAGVNANLHLDVHILAAGVGAGADAVAFAPITGTLAGSVGNWGCELSINGSVTASEPRVGIDGFTSVVIRSHTSDDRVGLFNPSPWLPGAGDLWHLAGSEAISAPAVADAVPSCAAARRCDAF